MSQIKSLDYPDSNKIDLNQCYFQTVDENIQPDRDDMFRSGFNTDLWGVSKTSNVTVSYNDSRGLLEAAYDASSSAAELFVQSDYTLPSSNCYFAFDLGSVAYFDQEMSSTDKSFFVRIVDKSDSTNNQLEIRLVTNSNGNPVLEVEDLRSGSTIYTETGFGGTVTEKDPNGNFDGIFKSVDFKLVFSPNNKMYLFDGSEKIEASHILEESYDLNGYNNLRIEFGLDIASGATDSGGGKMLLKPFKMFPVMDKMIGDNIVPVPYMKDDGFCNFYFEPPYPAYYEDVSVYGCGTFLGGSPIKVGDLNVLDTYDEEDSKKFLTSKVERFYTDEKLKYVCRDKAREVDVNGGLNVNMSCFCDGSGQDDVSQKLKLHKTSEPSNRYTNIADNPIFKMVGEDGPIGYGFDFSRRFVDDPNLKTSEPIKFLNSFKYDEDTVVYYGATHSPVGGDSEKKRIDIEYENVDTYSSEVDWSLYNVNRASTDGDGDGSSDSFVGSGTKTSNETDTHNLDRGRYRLHITGDAANNGVTVRIYFGDKANGNRILEVDTREHFGELTDLTGTTDNDLDIFFEVKQYQGDLVVYVHDICDNSVQKYEKAVNLSLLTDSLGCLKNGDGNLCFIYQEMSTLDVHGELQDTLSYERLDIENGSWEDSGTIEWPEKTQTNDREGQFIYAFDAVSSEDAHHIVFSLMNNVQRSDVPDGARKWVSFHDMDANEQSYGFPKTYPVVLENLMYRKSRGDDFVKERFERLEFNEKKAVSESSLRHLKRKSFDQSIPDRDGSEYNKIAYTGMSFFDCSYDKEYDELLVASLGSYRRIPFVMNGKKGLSGLYIPWHFNVGGFIKDHTYGKEHHDYISTYEERPNVFFSIESLSACFSNDGFVYTAATRFDENLETERVNAEVGLFEPSLEDSDDRDLYIELENRAGEATGGAGQEVKRGLERNFYYPKYKFQSIPVSSVYKGNTLGGDVRLRHLSINSHYQYMMLSGGGDYFNSPFMMVNGEYDPFPFETPSEEVYYPEFGTASEYSLDANVNNTGSYLEVSNEDSLNFPEVRRDLKPSTVPIDYKEILETEQLGEYEIVVNRGERADTGYKFHARMEEDFDGVTSFGRDVIFQTDTVYNQYYDHTDGSVKYRYYNSKARFKGDGTSYKCQVYNGKDGVWKTVDTISIDSSSQESIKDFYILIRQVDYDAKLGRGDFDVLFVIKERAYVQQGNSLQKYTYDISCSLVGDVIYAEAASEAGTGEYSKSDEQNGGPYSSMNVIFEDDESSDTSTDNGQDMRVYQMGWNLLKAKEHFRYNSPKKTDGDSYNIGGEARWRQEIRPSAGRFRSFNDAVLFRDQGGPSYYLRSFGLSGGRTANFHWYNGFKFNFSGEGGHIGDEYALERKFLSGVDALMSKKLYGLWNANDDDTEVKVWADSDDSDLQYFHADVVVVDGVNVPKVDLIGGSGGASNMFVFDTVDLRRFYFPSEKISFDHNSDKNEYVLQVDGADFNMETPKNFDYYFYNETDGTPNISKVSHFERDKIHLDYKDDPQYSPDEGGYIFSSRAVHLIEHEYLNDEFAQYPLLGFQFKPKWNTYGGNFSAKTLDFGVGRLMPIDYAHDVEAGRSEEIEGDVQFLYQDQPYSDFSYNDKAYELSYNVADPVTFMKLKSMIETVGVNKYPMWLVESLQGSKDNVFLTLIDGEPSRSVQVDQEGDKFYQLDVNFTVLK